MMMGLLYSIYILVLERKSVLDLSINDFEWHLDKCHMNNCKILTWIHHSVEQEIGLHMCKSIYQKVLGIS